MNLFFLGGSVNSDGGGKNARNLLNDVFFPRSYVIGREALAIFTTKSMPRNAGNFSPGDTFFPL